MRTLLASALMIAALFSPAAQNAPADLILHHATIYTADDRLPRAEAIAIRGDRIAAVGSAADILALKGPSTRIVDAGGATIVPGLQDSHGHFVALGASRQTLDLRGTTSYEQIVDRVRRRTAGVPRGRWIVGRSWDQNDWSDKRWPTHDRLTAAAPDNPVYLTRVDGHAALVNRKALEAAALTRATRDPDGGRIIRDEAGEPTGVLIDGAQDIVSTHIQRVGRAELEEQIRLADQETRSLTRLYVMLRGSMSMLKPHFATGPIANYGNHHLAVRAIKIVADGALGSRGAALIEPYADEPDTLGLLTTPPDEVYTRTLAASKAGFQTYESGKPTQASGR